MKRAAAARAVTPRALAPAPSLALLPLIVSDQTCFAACGLKPEQFRLLVAKAEIPHQRFGNRLLVAAADLQLYIRGDQVAPVSPDVVAPEAGDDDQVTDVDAALLRLNRRRTA